MKIVESILEKMVIKIITDMEKLTEEIEVDGDVSPIEQAKIAIRNKPTIAMLMRKQMLLTVLKGVG